jgi:hypothetical protein
MTVGSAASAGAAPLLLTLQGLDHEDVAATVLFRHVGLSESTGRVDLAGLDFHGGSAKKGIPTGASADFWFSLVGDGMLGLDEQSFLGPGAGAGRRAFAARFQQVAGPEGDVASVANPPTAAVSEPTTLLLTGLGLLALASLHRRRASSRSAGSAGDTSRGR